MAVSKWLGWGANAAQRGTTRAVGNQGEARALAHLQAAGLTLVARNFKSPGRGGGEVDLIMREPDGTLVFVEVRQRAGTAHGGAAASVGGAKQRRIIFAARHYLARLATLPPCRFDVVALQGVTGGDTGEVQWLRGAFDATGCA
jgi:putative endonuclease